MHLLLLRLLLLLLQMAILLLWGICRCNCHQVVVILWIRIESLILLIHVLKVPEVVARILIVPSWWGIVMSWRRRGRVSGVGVVVGIVHRLIIIGHDWIVLLNVVVVVVIIGVVVVVICIYWWSAIIITWSVTRWWYIGIVIVAWLRLGTHLYGNLYVNSLTNIFCEVNQYFLFYNFLIQLSFF